MIHLYTFPTPGRLSMHSTLTSKIFLGIIHPLPGNATIQQNVHHKPPGQRCASAVTDRLTIQQNVHHKSP